MNDAMEKDANGELARAEVTRGYAAPPRVDIVETENEIRLFADMPGVTQNTADIRFENGELSIHGRRGITQREGSFYLHEAQPRDYFRTFRISEEVDAQKIWAEMKNGVLMLHLPKAEKAKPRKIAIRGSS